MSVFAALAIRPDAAGLVRLLGGAAKVAAALSMKAGAVRAWTHRNEIPRRAWPELIDAFPAVTLDALRATELSAEARA